MKLALWILPSCVLSLFLASCGNNTPSDPNQTVGPFDAQGNYHEEWADNPKMWRKSGGTPSPHVQKSDYLPPIASNNDQPPLNSVPLAPKSSKPAPVINHTEITEKPKVTSKKPEPVVVRSTTKPKPEPEVASRSTTRSKTRSKPEPEVASKSTRTKSKSTVAKTKPKPKPSSTRYTVKAGDSLSAIAGRTGSSVSAIKDANGISGTLIRPGQSLKIPKK